MKKVTIYTTDSCPHCKRAKDLLTRKKITFEEIDITHDDAQRDALEKKTGWMTTPMIFMGDELIGGADELVALEKSGELEKKLQ